MQKILILGGGFAAVAAARRLENHMRSDEAVVTLVSRENFLLFTPMLPEVASGGIEARHVVAPLRSELRRTRFVLGEVSAIDLDAKSVVVQHILGSQTETLSYDQLVIALGGVTSTFGIPGVAEHAIPLKSLEDASVMRNRIIATLELADAETPSPARAPLLTYVIVGGGFTGVETAGELLDFFQSVSRYYRSIQRKDMRVVLVEGGQRLLPELPAAMGSYSLRDLRRRGVEVRLGGLVKSMDANGLSLSDGTRIDSRTVVWAAGVRPAPVVGALPVEHGRGGAVLTNRDMSVPGRPGVWAAGDCATIPSAEDGAYYPATAQHAIREGPALADNIVAALRGKKTAPFRYTALGYMASLGARHGVASVAGGLVVTGFLAWWLWRTYYLLRLPGLDRKLRVAFDWALDLLFVRDVAELRIYTERANAAAHAAAGLRPPNA